MARPNTLPLPSFLMENWILIYMMFFGNLSIAGIEK
jgi:hypothetical protein